MASPKSIRELRYVSGTTFNTTFVAADNDAWNTTNAVKLRIVDFDDSGLTHEGIQDETLQTRFYSRGAAINGLRVGTLKFSIYGGAAESTTSANPEATLISKFLGGIQNPTNARSTTVDSGTSTTTNVLVDSADTYVVAGQCALIGTKGDGRGGGELYPINAVASSYIELSSATAAAPTDGDQVVFTTTVYPDEDATQDYIDTLAIGHATADQRQTVGGMGTVKLSKTGVGELPQFDIELMPADHQFVASGDRDSLTSGTSVNGKDPPFDKSIGAMKFADHGSSTRKTVKGGDIDVELGVSYEQIPDPAGANGIGGWQKVPGSPTASFTLLYDEDMLGLRDDFEGKTAKTVLLQFGHEKGKTLGVELPKAYLDAAPDSAAIGGLSGIKVSVHGDEDFVASNDLRSAAVRLHWA